jgi:hypothetical protein
MSLTKEEISNIIGKYNLNYPSHLVESSLQKVVDYFGIEFLESAPKFSLYHIAELIDTGLMIDELEGVEGRNGLFRRLKNRERAAYSEARLATFFSKKGYEVKLDPRGSGTKINDFTVKWGDDWINFEVKTPEESELQQEINQLWNHILTISKAVHSSRDIYICLKSNLTEEESEALQKKVIEQSKSGSFPKTMMIGEYAWVRIEESVREWEKEGNKWTIPANLNSYTPLVFKQIYNQFSLLFFNILGWNKERIVSINLTIPFEDNRLFEFLHKKGKQVSRDSRNIVAIDTSRISLKYPGETRQTAIITDKKIMDMSKRIGAVLLFQNIVNEGTIHVSHYILEHPEPYCPIPNDFLEKCDLDTYMNLFRG